MLGSELFIGCISSLKALRHNHRIQFRNRVDRKTIQLEDLLQELDFGYDIINGELRLVDLQGVKLHNVESDYFPIDNNLSTILVNRLSININDYILEPIRAVLYSITGKRPEDLSTAKDILKHMQDYCYLFTNKQFLILEAIIDPTKIRIDNVIRNTKRSN